MDQGPLVDEEIDAGAVLVRQFAEDWPVRSAFWYKDADDFARNLYVVLDRSDPPSVREGGVHIWHCFKQIDSPYLSLLNISLLRPGDDRVAAAQRVAGGFIGKTITRFARDSEGEMAVEDVYIYPLPAPAAVS